MTRLEELIQPLDEEKTIRLPRRGETGPRSALGLNGVANGTGPAGAGTYGARTAGTGTTPLPGAATTTPGYIPASTYGSAYSQSLRPAQPPAPAPVPDPTFWRDEEPKRRRWPIVVIIAGLLLAVTLGVLWFLGFLG
jgi:hypothetical protein